MATDTTNILKGVTLQQESDKTKTLILQPGSGATTGTSTTVTAVQTANRIITLPDASGTLVVSDAPNTGAQRLQNKELDDATVLFVDNLDTTKKLAFQLSGLTTGTTRTLTVPDASTTIVGTDTAQAITAKTLLEVDNLRLDGNTISSLDVNGNIVISPNGTGSVDVATSKIINLSTPTLATDAANKTYVDTEISSSVAANAANRTLSNLNSPVALNQDLVSDTDGARDLGTPASYFGDIFGFRFFEKQVVNSTTTGADQDISAPTTSYLKFTNATLTSIRSIVAGGNGQIIEITNDTGSTILIRNESGGATAANRILTGSGADLTLASDASLRLIYDTNDSRWRVIGGSGSGGGSTFLDSAFRILDNGDITKQLAFEVSAITTGTTRTWLIPDISIDFSASVGGTYANAQLSNLSATAVNANINPGTDDTRILGTTSLRWGQVVSSSFVASAVGGGILMQRNGTSPSGVTLQGYVAPVIGSSTSPIALYTNDDSNVNATATNNLLLESGNKTAGTGGSGLINIKSGTSVGGVTGVINLTTGNSTSSNSGDINLTTGTAGSVRGLINHSALGHIFITGPIRTTTQNDTTLTGANQDATPTSTHIRFSNASLTSIRTISHVLGSGQLLVLTNATGGTLTLVNQSAGGTADARIITGTGLDLLLADGASAFLVYDSTTTRWRVIGESGGSSSFVSAIRSESSNYTATLNDEVILASSTPTILLPLASTATRKKYIIKKVGVTTQGPVVVDGNGSETIDGALTFHLINQYDSITIICDGTSWFII